MKHTITLLFLMLSLNACNQEQSRISASQTLATIFEEYYQFKDRINPIEATKGGNFQYNEYIANYISDAYQTDLIAEYSIFLEHLAQIDPAQLSQADLLSMKVMQWDCEVKLEGLQNPLVITTSPIYNLPSFELTPLIQVQSLHLYVAQLGAGGSVHPFNTIKDNENR